jgi:hypothetical protein
MPNLKNIPVLRLLVGAVQGLLLFLLYQAYEHDLWPATEPYVFLPLALLSFFLPLILSVGLGNIQARSLAKWLGFVAVVVVVLAVYRIDVYVGGPAKAFNAYRDIVDEIFAPLFAVLCAGIFIGHTLIVAAEAEKKFIAAYRGYFDYAWKHGVQVVSAAGFTAIFWVLLYLGAELFKIIKIDLLYRLIQQPWFAIPATTLVVAAAFHMTDVRPGIVAGIRTLALTLLAWLLPIMTVIVAVFLVVLPFEGFDLLWGTSSATALLLAVSAVLIVLINAVYQDGFPEKVISKALTYTAYLGAIMLTPLFFLGTYGLTLRVIEYGWTQTRMIAAACLAVAGGYAFGYALALWKDRSSFVERSNIAMAFAIPAILLVLFSPIADPARISVASQLARLQAGSISVDKFDVAYFRFEAGRYGIEALEGLKANKNPELVTRIDDAFATPWAMRYQFQQQQAVISVENIALLPEGKNLPQSFIEQKWTGARPGTASHDLPECMLDPAQRCKALLADLDGDGVEEVVLLPETDNRPVIVFKLMPNTVWEVVGTLSSRLACSDTQAELLAGKWALAAPKWRDIEIADRRFRFSPTRDDVDTNCP